MLNVIKYPEWKHAVDKIVEKVEFEGYGIIITHEQLLEYFSMEEPEKVEDFKKFQLKLMSYIVNLVDALLIENNICLMNIRGKGYQVLNPNEQIEIAPEHYYQKARKQLNRAMKTLIHVDADLLSGEKKQQRLDKMKRMAFIKSAMNKRKIPFTENKKIESS